MFFTFAEPSGWQHRVCVRNPLTKTSFLPGFSGETHCKHNNSEFTFIVLFHLFQSVMKPWQPVFGQWRQTLSAFYLFYFFIFLASWSGWYLSQTRQRVSDQQHERGWPSLQWNVDKRNRTDRLTDGAGAREESQHDKHRYLPNLDTGNY